MSETSHEVKGGHKRPNSPQLNEALNVKKVRRDIEDSSVQIGKGAQTEDVTNCIPENVGKITHSSQVEKTKRKMVAILMAYSGQGYLGMQRNPGAKTIEHEFLSALLKSDIIYQDHYEIPQNMRFQRSCRTDKGVSASRQIVSLRAGLVDDLVDKINSFLPPQIRVFGYKRVTQNFNCKTRCDARTYSYTLPTFAFTPVEEITTEEHRTNQQILDQVNEVLSRFKGTHLFHNFTAGRTANDASCQRYIIHFECGQPFVREGLEFVTITVKGQSFMLHQIRKMIGLAIAIVRGVTSVDTIVKAWCPNRLDIPIAPGLGLVLEEVHYDKYNDRYGKDGLHEALTWEEYKDQVDKFKEDFILPTIISTEKNEKSLLKWLATLLLHTFDVRQPAAPNEAAGTRVLASMAHDLRRLDEAEKAENEECDQNTSNSNTGLGNPQHTGAKEMQDSTSELILKNSNVETKYADNVS